MSDVEWIKITVGMFDNRKIKHIRKLPEGNNIVLIWVMLLTMAGRCNASGFIFLTENIPYTTKMLADELGFDESVIMVALEILEKFDMIRRDGDLLSIPGWEEHQNTEGLEKVREQTRKRVSEYREKQRKQAELLECNVTCNVTETLRNATVTQQNKNKNIDKEIEEEKDILTISNEIVCRKQSQEIIERWNKLQDVGIKPVSRIAGNSERNERLKARIRQYGMEKVLYAIEKIRESDFLQGKNRDGWVITFDWFVKPNNFPKVLDGNYDNRSGTKSYQSQTKQMLDSSYEMMGDWARKRMKGDGENDT